MAVWLSFTLFFSLLDLEVLVEDKDANKFVQLKGVEIYLWLVAVGHEGVIAQDVALDRCLQYKQDGS